MAPSARAICEANPSASDGDMPPRMRRRRSPCWKVLHRQVGVIVGDAELVQAHDVGVAHALRDLVFLQKARERLIDAAIHRAAKA